MRGYGAGKPISGYAQSYVAALGIDSASSTVYRYTGPLGSRVYSPLASLIESAGGQSRIKRAFGLDSGAFALSADRDLTTFDPATALSSGDSAVRQDGGRIAAANLRASATAAALTTVRTGEDPGPGSQYEWEEIDYPSLGARIGSNDSFLFDDARMMQIVTGLVPAGRYRPDVLSAAAHLIDAYASAIGAQVTDTATAAQFMLGIRGYLEPELVALLKANSASAASAAMATSAQTIVNRTAIFRETLPFPATGFFFPTTDFFIGSSGTPLTLQTRWTANANASLQSNDLYWRAAENGGGVVPSDGVVNSVSVSSANASRITATLSGDTITVSAKSGFSGTAYFDYRVTHTSGEQGTARVFVLFR